VVEGAREALAPAVAGRQLKVRIEVPDEPVVLDGDISQLERAVINLLGNAVKFTPDGGAVTVRLVQEHGTVRLEFKDTGIGIPEDERQHLFSRFFRSSNAKEGQIQGTGLGLYIVGSIISAHRGSVEVESEQGRGTTFTVLLPLGADSELDGPGATDGHGRGGR
ncbi:MAG: sensor histidine kinase, partial [Actinomycetes bacterium]